MENSIEKIKNVTPNFFYKIRNAVRMFYWAIKNPESLSLSHFKLISDLLGIILKASSEHRHMMTQIAFVHPTNSEDEIISLWVGSGIGASPTKRLSELLEENSLLKAQLSKQIVLQNNTQANSINLSINNINNIKVCSNSFSEKGEFVIDDARLVPNHPTTDTSLVVVFKAHLKENPTFKVEATSDKFYIKTT